MRETDPFDNDGAYEQSLLEVVGINERINLCNDWNGDYFFSIHHNTVSDPSVNYTLTLYPEKNAGKPYDSATVNWANYTTTHLLEVMNVTTGYTSGDITFLGYGLTVLQGAQMPAIQTEASFFSNPDERLLLNQNSYLEAEAGAIFDAFVQFIGP